jgi:hypothetical protein
LGVNRKMHFMCSVLHSRAKLGYRGAQIVGWPRVKKVK